MGLADLCDLTPLGLPPNKQKLKPQSGWQAWTKTPEILI
jgi:hypothetical protein